MKRSKDPAQAALFEIAPEKPKRSKLTVVEYTPTKREPTMMVIHYIGTEDVSHVSCSQSMVDRHIDFSIKYHANLKHEPRTYKVMGWDDYWEKHHKGGFELGKAH